MRTPWPLSSASCSERSTPGLSPRSAGLAAGRSDSIPDRCNVFSVHRSCCREATAGRSIWVGAGVDGDLMGTCGRAGVVRLIPWVATDTDGRWLNVNADTAAAAVAAQVHAEKLVLLTDTAGILLDRRDDGSLVRSLDAAGCR